MIVDKPLPQSWTSKRLKYVATYNDEALQETTDDETEIDYVEISGVSLTGGIEEVNRMSFYQAPSRARRKVQAGDILVSTVRTYLKAIATVGADTSEALIASTGFCVVRPGKEMDSSYLGWVAKSEPFVSEVVARSVGVSYPAINASDLVDMSVPVPPIPAQQRIARFLDEKTARIDALIEKKQALLARLAEKRQALITGAVTKGLNPDASMKPSGVDWLGDIPAHWGIAPLRWYVRTASGDAIRNEDIEADRAEFGAIPVIGGNGLMGFTEATANSYGTLIAVGRVGALCGNVHLINEPSWVTDNALKVHGIRDYDVSYLLYALRVRDLNALASRNAQPLMTGEIVRAQQMPMPPIREQERIGQHINCEVTQLEVQRGLIRQGIERLEEYRSALITAAVTGQLPELNG